MRAHLNGGIDPIDDTTEALWRERLGGRLAAQMPLEPAHSLRFIGVEDDNREIVRVDRFGTERRRSHRPGSRAARASATRPISGTRSSSPRMQIYVSPVHLIEENGVIETPQVADHADRDAGA